MASKSNIFNSLPQHQSDSEGEDNTRVAKRTNEKRDAKTGNKKTAGGDVANKGNKDSRPQKGVSSEPHPLDRHSGTGHSAYGAKPKKGGAGKGNWGTEKRPKVEGKEEEEREGEDETQETKEEEKPQLTLEEYYQRRGATQNEPQVNEAKAKITSEQLYKEMGTATLLKSRQNLQVDDHKVGKKKDHLDINHKAGVNTEHANLLNFRTGFVEKEYKQRGQDDAAPRKPAPRQNKTEEAKEETQPATQAAEGETQPVTEGQTAEGQSPVEGQDNQNRRRQDGQRGGNRGGYKGGDRNQGGRKPHGGKPQQAKVDFADESAFPKLG